MLCRQQCVCRGWCYCFIGLQCVCLVTNSTYSCIIWNQFHEGYKSVVRFELYRNIDRICRYVLESWCEFEECELTAFLTGRVKVKVLLLSLLPVGLFIFWIRVKWFYRGTSEIFAVGWIFADVASSFTNFISVCISPVVSVMYCDNRSESKLTLHILCFLYLQLF